MIKLVKSGKIVKKVKPTGAQKMVKMINRAGLKIDTHGKSGKADKCDRFRGRYPTDWVVSEIGYTRQAGLPIGYSARLVYAIR